jgi:hypothetical protein
MAKSANKGKKGSIEAESRERDCEESLKTGVRKSKYMPREWNTSFREPWNPLIKKCLDGVDLHNKLYFETQDAFQSEPGRFIKTFMLLD